MVPYVEKSIFYENPIPKINNQTPSISFENWKSRAYQFVMIGKFSAAKVSYKFRYDFNNNLGILDNMIQQKNLTNSFHYIYAARGRKAYWGHDISHKATWPDCDCINQTCHSCIMIQGAQAYLKYLYQSKFGLVIFGDTPTTSRLYDLIASGTIPIILSRYIVREGLPFIDKIPYYKFCYFINEHQNFDRIYADLMEILTETSEAEYREKYENLKLYSKDLLWRQPGNRIVENILVEANGECNHSR